MYSKSCIAQKNMVPILLIFLCNVLSRKNIRHAGFVEKLGGVVQVPLMADFCYFC
jgi:hypothetical protein